DPRQHEQRLRVGERARPYGLRDPLLNTRVDGELRQAARDRRDEAVRGERRQRRPRDRPQRGEGDEGGPERLEPHRMPDAQAGADRRRRERAEREGGPDDADRRRLIEREAEHPTADAVLADGERQEDEQEAVERAQHRAAGERGQDEPPGEDLVAVLLPLPPRDHDQPWEYLGWIG